MTSEDRPLHPLEDHPELFQHPIKGFIIQHPDTVRCRVNDFDNLMGDTRDTNIYVGVEVFRARNELGTWLTECHPDPKHKLLNHLFVEEVFPCDFEGEDSGQQQALLGRIDMTNSVMEAGGACTICGAPNDEGHVDHLVGCEYMSWMLFVIAKQITDAAGEPTLAEVVRSAHEQIARMQ